MVETIITPDPLPLTIEEKIMAKAKEYGYSPTRAIAIAKAESGLFPDAKNTSSTASGLFQFINGTAQGFCVEKYEIMESLLEKNDPDKQIECAVRMLAEGGEGHWSESRHVWGVTDSLVLQVDNQ